MTDIQKIEPYKPELKQDEFRGYALGCPEGRRRAVLFGGSRGPGKTSALANEFIDQLVMYPGNHGFLGRKVLDHLRVTGLKTLWQWLPKEIVEGKNEQKKEIYLTNSSLISYGGFTETEDTTRIKGMETGVVAVTQVEELVEEEFIMLMQTLRLILPDGTRPPYLGLFDANPRQNWVKKRFVVPETRSKNFFFVSGVPSDNSHLPEDYEENLEEDYKGKPRLLKIYKEGNWDVSEEDNSVYMPRWLDDAWSKEINYKAIKNEPVVVYCDASAGGGGGDKTVIYGVQGHSIIYEDISSSYDLVETEDRIVLAVTKTGAVLTGVDQTGLGEGLYKNLVKKRGLRVKGLKTKRKSRFPDKYSNLRNEIYWLSMDDFRDGKPMLAGASSELKRQLQGITYTIPEIGGWFNISSKDELRKILGCSPDEAEAYIGALYLLRFVHKEIYSKQQKNVNIELERIFGEESEADKREPLLALTED